MYIIIIPLNNNKKRNSSRISQRVKEDLHDFTLVYGVLTIMSYILLCAMYMNNKLLWFFSSIWVIFVVSHLKEVKVCGDAQ